VFCHDVRMQGRPLFTLAYVWHVLQWRSSPVLTCCCGCCRAHDKATSSISFNAFIPDLLATASLDKTVRVSCYFVTPAPLTIRHSYIAMLVGR